MTYLGQTSEIYLQFIPNLTNNIYLLKWRHVINITLVIRHSPFSSKQPSKVFANALSSQQMWTHELTEANGHLFKWLTLFVLLIVREAGACLMCLAGAVVWIYQCAFSFIKCRSQNLLSLSDGCRAVSAGIQTRGWVRGRAWNLHTFPCVLICCF